MLDLSAVVSLAEYKARVGRLTTDTVDDATIEGLLATVTRVVERRIGAATGMLIPQTGATITLDGKGGSRLYLRDESDRQFFVRTITADSLKVDTDGDGTFNYLLDAADLWVRLGPVNAANAGEPYTWIDLVPTVSTASILAWPNLPASIQITGALGWASTPGALRERVSGIVRELLDAHRAGAAGITGYGADEMIESVPGARALMAMIEREYSYRLAI